MPLIHRDYIVLGAEIHIDMYDDRLEINSPGGMYGGKAVQECNIDEIESARRNPVIADLFHRMKFMERRGSGLRKILIETEKLPGYTQQLKPEFFSTPSSFRTTLRNVNYISRDNTPQDIPQVTPQDKIILFCAEPRSKIEIAGHCGYKDMKHFTRSYLKPLLESGQLQMTIPDKPNSRNQKYVSVKK